jgi:hypothetical protein
MNLRLDTTFGQDTSGFATLERRSEKTPRADPDPLACGERRRHPPPFGFGGAADRRHHDLHGDLVATRRALPRGRIGGTIDGWGIVVVQTGDQLDRGTRAAILANCSNGSRTKRPRRRAVHPLNGNPNS